MIYIIKIKLRKPGRGENDDALYLLLFFFCNDFSESLPL